MALTYQQVYQQAQDPNWIQRVAAAATLEAARAISVDVPDAGVNTRRDILSRRVLMSPDAWAQTMSLAVALGFLASDSLGESDVTDAQLFARVAAIWNDYLDPA